MTLTESKAIDFSSTPANFLRHTISKSLQTGHFVTQIFAQQFKEKRITWDILLKVAL